MSTFPATETLPDVDVRYPPDNVRSPLTVSAYGPLASPPAEIVREDAVNEDAKEMVPVTIREANACEAPIATVPVATVRVTVDDPALNAEDGPDVSHGPDSEMDPLVREIELADASFIVTPATVIDDVVARRRPPPEIVRLAPPVMPFPDVVNVPVTESVPLTSIAVFSVTVPEIARVRNPFDASSVATVFPVPDNVIELVPLTKVEPAPDVSQWPLTVQVPLVRVIVPDPPPVIVTSATATVDAFAWRIPKSPTARDPPVRERSDVARAVVEPAPP